MNNEILNHAMAAKVAVSAILAGLTALWGWFGWLVIAWIGLMFLDWMIGSFAAMKSGKWSSAKLREGAWHKGGEMIMVGIALVLDLMIRIAFPHIPIGAGTFQYTVLFAPLVIVWYVIGELGSLAEHAVTFGAPVPKFLLKVLDAAGDAVDAAGEKLVPEREGDGHGSNQ
jgi:phage-related holin